MALPRAPLRYRWRRHEMTVAFWPSPTRQERRCNLQCCHPRGAARLPHPSMLLCSTREDKTRPKRDKRGRRTQRLRPSVCKQRCCPNSASIFSMKWRPGLAVITRTEHWEQAARHLWGLSRSDMAAYLPSELQENFHPADDARKLRIFCADRDRANRATAFDDVAVPPAGATPPHSSNSNVTA